MTNDKLPVRILPMSTKDEEFQGKKHSSVQNDYFLYELPLYQKGRYGFVKKGLDAKPDTIVLFQYNNSVIASAVFKGQGRDYLQFDIDSIKVFEPVGAKVFEELWSNEFKMFSNVKQSLSSEPYTKFEQQLKNVRSPSSFDITDVNQHFEKSIQNALKRSTEDRRIRISNAPRIPTKVKVTTTTFKRNADVVAEVLARAQGICEKCKCSAPFLRQSDGTPYLEVHHILRLADGGEDTVENAIALCPNCHRKEHYG